MKMVSQVPWGPQDSQESQEIVDLRERRVNVAMVSQDPEAFQAPPAPPGPLAQTDLPLWTWKGLDSLIWRTCGASRVYLAPLGLLGPLAPRGR